MRAHCRRPSHAPRRTSPASPLGPTRRRHRVVMGLDRIAPCAAENLGECRASPGSPARTTRPFSTVNSPAALPCSGEPGSCTARSNELVADGRGRGVNHRRERAGQHRAAGHRRPRVRRVAKAHGDLLGGHAEGFGGHLRQHGVGAGADVDPATFHLHASIGANPPGPPPRRAAGSAGRSPSPCPSRRGHGPRALSGGVGRDAASRTRGRPRRRPPAGPASTTACRFPGPARRSCAGAAPWGPARPPRRARPLRTPVRTFRSPRRVPASRPG